MAGSGTSTFFTISALTVLLIAIVPLTSLAEETPSEDEDLAETEATPEEDEEDDDEYDIEPEEFDEDVQRSGEATPDGRRRRDRAYLGHIVAGWLTFGLAYVPGVNNAIMNGTWGIVSCWTGFLPIVGPAICGTAVIVRAVRCPRDSLWDVEVFLGATVIFIGAVQALGSALLVYGHVQRARRQREHESRRHRTNIALLPAGPGGPGVSVAGWF